MLLIIALLSLSPTVNIISFAAIYIELDTCASACSKQTAQLQQV